MAMAVMRAIAPLRWCQISATACGPASSPARLRARSTASIRRQPARGGGGQGEEQQADAAREVPPQEAAGDVVDRLGLGLRAGERVEDLRGRGVALDGAHGEAGTQRAVDPQARHVELGVADLHQLRRPGQGQGRCAGADGQVLAERDDVLFGRQRDRDRHADEQAERHEQHRRPGPQLAEHSRAVARLVTSETVLRDATAGLPRPSVLDRFSVPGRRRSVTRPTS
jgi:hypothetical protein